MDWNDFGQEDHDHWIKYEEYYKEGVPKDSF